MARHDSKTNLKATLRDVTKVYNGRSLDDDYFELKTKKTKRNRIRRKRDE